MGHAILNAEDEVINVGTSHQYSQSHKVATLSKVPKVKVQTLNMQRSVFRCSFLCQEFFERSLALQLYGTYYINKQGINKHQ